VTAKKPRRELESEQLEEAQPVAPAQVAQASTPRELVYARYDGKLFTVDLAGIRSITDYQDAVKEVWPNRLKGVAAPDLIVTDEDGKPVVSLSKIPDDYFRDPEEDGKCLNVTGTLIDKLRNQCYSVL
jgi:hypothetical protein